MQPSSRRRLCGPADDLAAAGSGACAHGSNVARERCSIGMTCGGRSPCRQQQPSALSWQLRGRREADNRQHTCRSRMQRQTGGRCHAASQQDVPMAASCRQRTEHSVGNGVLSPPPSHPTTQEILQKWQRIQFWPGGKPMCGLGLRPARMQPAWHQHRALQQSRPPGVVHSPCDMSECSNFCCTQRQLIHYSVGTHTALLLVSMFSRPLFSSFAWPPQLQSMQPAVVSLLSIVCTSG